MADSKQIEALKLLLQDLSLTEKINLFLEVIPSIESFTERNDGTLGFYTNLISCGDGTSYCDIDILCCECNDAQGTMRTFAGSHKVILCDSCFEECNTASDE